MTDSNGQTVKLLDTIRAEAAKLFPKGQDPKAVKAALTTFASVQRDYDAAEAALEAAKGKLSDASRALMVATHVKQLEIDGVTHAPSARGTTVFYKRMKDGEVVSLSTK